MSILVGGMSLLLERFSLKEKLVLYAVYPSAPASRSQTDKLVWLGTSNGFFFVRSAYHLAKEKSISDRGMCSSSANMDRLWNQIWNIKGAHVVKMFLWKACNDILATKLNLFNKGIVPGSLCPIYLLEVETLEHIICSCPSAMDVWVECSKKFHKCSLVPASLTHILEFLLLRLEDEDIQLFAVVARQIWLRRNSFIFGGDLIPPSQVVILAKDQLQAFLAAEQTRIGGSIRPPQPNSCISWTPPSLDVIKFNWDAAISKREQRMGMGFLARNSAGQVLASYCATKPYIVDPGIAEAVSAWKMIEVAVSLGFQSVIFEGNSLEIVQALRNEGCCLGRFGQVVNEAKIC